jgi:ribosomal protein S17E
MDFSNHRLNRQSIIESREINKVNPSIIDSYHQRFKKRFEDSDFNKGMTIKIVQNLSEAKIEELSDYIDRNSNIHKGKAFVKLCNNVILDKISNSS